MNCALELNANAGHDDTASTREWSCQPNGGERDDWIDRRNYLGGTGPRPHARGIKPKPLAGAFCHIEMYAADRAKSAEFMRDLFGWGLTETMPQYTAFDTGGGIGGILQPHTPSLPAVAYNYTNDDGAKLMEIEDAGGKRGELMHMAGMATFGYFHDPSGSQIGLIGPLAPFSALVFRWTAEGGLVDVSRKVSTKIDSLQRSLQLAGVSNTGTIQTGVPAVKGS